MDKDSQAHQQKKTAQAHIDAHRKKLSAGLFVASGNHALGPVVTLARNWEGKGSQTKHRVRNKLNGYKSILHFAPKFMALCTEQKP